VPGHAGRLVLGDVGGVRVAVLEGRVHRYEGWSVEEVTRGVRALARLGVPALVLTNASGGIVEEWTPPLLMRVTDHIDLQSTRLSFPEKGLHAGGTCASISGELQVEAGAHRRETRRADARHEAPREAQRERQNGSPYDTALGRAIELAAREAGIPLFHGIYAGLLGPTYETPAEIRMLRWMGADAVGMSTVAEAAAASAAGMRVAAISCVANAGAGLAAGPLSHDEVVAVGAQVAEQLCALLERAVPRLAAAP
jgi:purine-nucleoside phosphorylase